MPAINLHRIDGEGIYSHIYNKGIEGRIIFCDNDDYEVFLGFLQDYLTAPKDPDSVKKTFQVRGRTFRGTPHQPKNYLNKVELIAYNLMPDHFHLLLHQKTRGSLENFIRSLCTRYSMYFNKKYQRTGTLFGGPYKSVPIRDESHLSYLSRFFHYTGGYSSYPEYLGARVTSWIKPKVVLSFFDKKKRSYKDFVEKYELGQKEKELTDGITLDNETGHLERRGLAREALHPNPDWKSHLKMPAFLTISTVVFLLLVTLGIRNIAVATTKSAQPLPTPAILAETEEVKPESAQTEEVKPTVILTIKTDDGSSKVNIRQQPATNSGKVGKAKDGDTFEFISIDSGWYEVKLADGSTGFISAKYLVKEEKTTNE